MRTAIVVAAILFAVAACGKDTPGAAGPGGAAPPAPAAAPAPPATADGLYDFEADAEGAAPKGFHSGLTGAGKAGTWVVRVPEGGAGRVLAQTDADPTMDRYPIAIAPAPSLADLRVSVRGRALSGLEDEAFGVVFRYRDDRNYYLARANALEANVRIYCVKDGWRREFGSADAEVKEADVARPRRGGEGRPLRRVLRREEAPRGEGLDLRGPRPRRRLDEGRLGLGVRRPPHLPALKVCARHTFLPGSNRERTPSPRRELRGGRAARGAANDDFPETGGRVLFPPALRQRERGAAGAADIGPAGLQR